METERDRAERLGAAIRERRRAQGLTLVEVARRTGLTHGFLSQLERGRSNSSLRSLFLIADVLGTTQQVLLAAASPGTDDGGARRRDAETGVGGSRVVLPSRGALSITEYTKEPGPPGDFFEHAHAELLYVVSGRLTVETAEGSVPQPPVRLGEGDSYLVPGARPHRHIAEATSCRYLLVTLPDED